MKKFSKFMALSMALALTFGMTALANGSDNTDRDFAQAAQGTAAVALDASGNTLDVNVEVNAVSKEAAKSETITADVAKADAPLTVAIKAAASELGTIKTPTLITVIDINVTPDGGGNLPKGARVTVMVPCKGIAPAKDGFKYVLMHLNGDKWEAVSDVTIGNDSFTFVSGSFSPYALFLVEKEETTTPPASSTNSSTTTQESTPAPASEPVSPKTGESAPVAGFAALILLAGAVVCAKKVQLNN